MATKRLKRPRDPVQLAKLIGGDIATGQVQDAVEDRRDPAAVALGQKGGKARADSRSKKSGRRSLSGLLGLVGGASICFGGLKLHVEPARYLGF